MKVRVIPKGRPYLMLPLGVGPLYAEKGGMPCLRWETSWKKLNGFRINTKWGCIWVELRRVCSW